MISPETSLNQEELDSLPVEISDGKELSEDELEKISGGELICTTLFIAGVVIVVAGGVADAYEKEIRDKFH